MSTLQEELLITMNGRTYKIKGGNIVLNLVDVSSHQPMTWFVSNFHNYDELRNASELFHSISESLYHKDPEWIKYAEEESEKTK